MINIISRSANARRIGGQIKVFRNLTHGLDRIGFPYVVNRRLDSCPRLWVHDDTRALPLVWRLPQWVSIVVGPNLYVLPRDVPKGLRLERVLYLQPSQWVVDLWRTLGFNACRMRAWPVGIDTRVFRPGEQQRTRILVYHKWRDPNELAQLISVLSNKGLQYDLVRYGAYEEREYVEKLLRARYVIWHGGHESQGIALQEAMACDVPIVVWDVTSLAQFYSGGAGYCFGPTERDLPATTAPYFDLACGIRVTSVDELTIAVERMEGEWDRLHPRVYVEEHLSLEKQARELVAMFDNQISGASEVVREGSWRPPLRSVARAAWNRLWRATWRRHGAPILERIFERKQQ